MSLTNKYPKNTLSDSPRAILSSLYNSNMAKVPIVKWCQNHFFVDRSAISGSPQVFKNAYKTGIFKKFGYARNDTSVHKNQILRPLYNRYFCHITIKKWSRNCIRTIRKCFFCNIYFPRLFPIEISITPLNIARSRKAALRNLIGFYHNLSF